MKRREPKSPTDMALMPADKVRRYTAEMIVALHDEIGLLQRQVESLNETTADLHQWVTLLTRAVEDVSNGERRLTLPRM